MRIASLIALLSAASASVQQYEFTVNNEGQKGVFVIEVNTEWAPLGAARFAELVDTPGFFDGVRFFRTIKGFMAQLCVGGKRRGA